jgi:pyridoxamine 5'-phosphate oxidase
MEYYKDGVPQELAEIEAVCWQLLQNGASSRKSALHQCTIATAVDGIALMRTVVLRRVEPESKQLYFHTDSRSSKLTDFKKISQLSWLFYDQSVATQIRLSGNIIVHQQDDLCRQHWDKTGHHSRRYYMSDNIPSVPLSKPSTGLNPSLTTFDYSIEESEKGYENFVVVESSIQWMEWYYTHHSGNKRAAFNYLKGQLQEANWVSP